MVECLYTPVETSLWSMCRGCMTFRYNETYVMLHMLIVKVLFCYFSFYKCSLSMVIGKVLFCYICYYQRYFCQSFFSATYATCFHNILAFSNEVLPIFFNFSSSVTNDDHSCYISSHFLLHMCNTLKKNSVTELHWGFFVFIWIPHLLI